MQITEKWIFSEFVEAKTWLQWLWKPTNSQLEAATQQIEDATERTHVDLIKGNGLVYKSLSIILKGLTCNSIKIHSNPNNSVNDRLKNRG